MYRKAFNEFEQHEQTEILVAARSWYAEHKDHVDRLVSGPDQSSFPPSGSDCYKPELWKSGSWKWLLDAQSGKKS
jgi:hypothetical protein